MDDFLGVIIIIAIIFFSVTLCTRQDTDIVCTSSHTYSVMIEDPETGETVRVNTDRKCSKVEKSGEDQSLDSKDPRGPLGPWSQKESNIKKDEFSESF